MTSGIPGILTSLLLSSISAGQTGITLQEHLNRPWKAEMVTYPFEAANGQCLPEGVLLTGPNGPMPVQLSGVVLWPDSQFVKFARLSFVVEELKPLTSHAYTVKYEARPVTETAATDLRIVAGTDKAEVVSSALGARFLLGDRVYDKPAPAAEVPGPLFAIRLADGSWFGGSRMFGDTPIKSYSARLVAQGPVFARAECTYAYDGGNTLQVAMQVHAKGHELLVETDVKESRPGDGWDLLFTPGLPPLVFQFPKEQVKVLADARPIEKTSWKEKAIADFPTGTVTQLTPWGDWTNEQTQPDVYLKFADAERQIAIIRADPGAWVEPREPVMLDWNSRLFEKLLPLMKGEDNSLFLRANNVAGQRKWTLGEETDVQSKFSMYLSPKNTMSGPPARLNEVKDMLLDWPDGPERHPFLFLSAHEFNMAGQRNPSALRLAQDVESLRAVLNRLGDFDLMRGLMTVAVQYDAIIDSNLLTPQERKLFKAQMAYLAHYAASPANWSAERFFRSGNPNMTVTHTMNQGVVGCVLRDHPMGRKWAEYASQRLKHWLSTDIDERGYWIESSHYARVAVSRMIYFAIAAQKAGFHDFFADPRFKEVGMFYEKTLTPPDPLRKVALHLAPGIAAPCVRAGAPYGRGTRGDVWGLGGLLATATATSDPRYSRIMEWSWRECGFSDHTGDAVGGMNGLYPNRDLPVERPDWRSEYFPHLGCLLRSHVGTPEENYLLFVSHYPRSLDGELWPADVGILSKWFANGRPVAGVFQRIPETSHVLLENRVLLACNWDPANGVSPDTGYAAKTTQNAFTSLPRLDYVSAGFEVTEVAPHLISMPKDAPAFPKRDKVGKAPFHWQRQLLLAKDDQPGGVNYLVLRDTVAGGQPTQWHFWTLSEKLGTPQEAANREEFLKDKPGGKVAPARELTGDRFAALGQFDVDLDYYIASPANTPRYTLRYGISGVAYGLGPFNEFQDLLHLQLPSDGDYFVAIFPRFRTEEPPVFDTMGKGRAIRISGKFGTDHCFLAREPSEVKAGEVSFKGTAAAVQERSSGLVLVAAAPGEVSYGDYSVTTPIPVSVRVAPYSLSVDLPALSPGGQVVLRLPGRWSPAEAQTDVKVLRNKELHTLCIPASARAIRLEKAR
jgi:hypothetical protein